MKCYSVAKPFTCFSGVLYNQFLSQADFEILRKYAEVMPHIFILVFSMAKTAFTFAYSRFSHMLVCSCKLVLWSVLKRVSQRRNRGCHTAGRAIYLVFFFSGSRYSAISPPLCNACDLKFKRLFVI